MTDGAAVDVRVLGQLLLMQSVVASLPNNAILPFVLQGLGDIPGVGRVEFQAEPLAASPYRVRLVAGATDYGTLDFSVADAAAFAPYLDHIRNFAFMLSVILDERRQRQIIERHEHKLEQQIAKRTAELADERDAARQYLDIAGVMLMALDSNGRIAMINKRGAQILGRPEDALIGTDWFGNFVPADERSAVRNVFERLLSGETQSLEYHENRIINAAGQELFMAWNNTALRNEAGVVVGTLSSAEDITKRKQVEAALRESEEQFRGLVEQSIAGIYIIQDGKYVYMNPRGAEILGYDSADELIGRDPLSRVAEKDRGAVRETMRSWLDGETRSVAYAFTALRKDGTMIELGVHGARATHLGLPAVIGLMQDISEKKRAEDEIKRYVTQLETAFMSTVGVATTLGEMRDPYTAGHQRRVAEIAVAIGAELGFDEHRQEGLRVAGYLHDIGKIAVPAEILSKPGKLSTIELQLIQAHPRAGYDVLKGVSFPWPVAEVALQHHERFDGSGYPHGLKGEAILIEALIVAVADVIEAMSSHRPYRPGLGIEKTLAEIERGRGSAYGQAVADACLTLFLDKGYTIPA